jgi:hypothetical protein
MKKILLILKKSIKVKKGEIYIYIYYWIMNKLIIKNKKCNLSDIYKIL